MPLWENLRRLICVSVFVFCFFKKLTYCVVVLLHHVMDMFYCIFVSLALFGLVFVLFCFLTYMCLQWWGGTGCGSLQWWWRWSKARWSESKTKAAARNKTHFSKECGPVVATKIFSIFFNFFNYLIIKVKQWLNPLLLLFTYWLPDDGQPVLPEKKFELFEESHHWGRPGWRTRQVSTGRRKSHTLTEEGEEVVGWITD